MSSIDNPVTNPVPIWAQSKVPDSHPEQAINLTMRELMNVRNDRRYPNVTKLTSAILSSWSSYRMTDSMLAKIAEFHPKICSQIQVLTFSKYDEISNKIIPILGKCFPNLQYLNLPAIESHRDGASDETCQLLLESYPKGLQELNFGLNAKLSEIGIKYLHGLGLKKLSLNTEHLNVCGHLPTLKYLRLENTTGNFDNLFKLLELNPQLEHLSIKNNHKFSTLHGITKALPNLKSLDLTGCRSIPQDAYRALKKLKKLKAINLTDCAINDHIVGIIARACPKLREVILASSSPASQKGNDINDKGAITVARYYHDRLRYLDLRNARITKCALEFLARNCRNLPRIENLQTCELIPAELRAVKELRTKELEAAWRPINAQAYVTKRNIVFLQESNLLMDSSKVDYRHPNFQKVDKGYFGAFVCSQESAKRREPITIKALEHWQKLITEEMIAYAEPLQVIKFDGTKEKYCYREEAIGHIRNPKVCVDVDIGEDLEGTNYMEVPKQLEDLLDHINHTLSARSVDMADDHFLKFVSEVFYKYLRMIPFLYNNLRTGTLLVNYIAAYCRRPVIIFDRETRRDFEQTWYATDSQPLAQYLKERIKPNDEGGEKKEEG